MILFKLLITSWLHHQKETATPKQKKPYNTNKQHQTEKQHQQQTTQKKNASFFSAKLFVFLFNLPPYGWVCPVQRFWAPSRREREGPAPLPRWCPALPPFREQAEAAKASVASKEKAWPWWWWGEDVVGNILGRIFFFCVCFWLGWKVLLLYVFFEELKLYKKTGKILIITKVFAKEWLKKTFLKLFLYNWTWIKTPFLHLWFVWIRRFPRWRFLGLLILWNENPTTYAVDLCKLFRNPSL